MFRGTVHFDQKWRECRLTAHKMVGDNVSLVFLGGVEGHMWGQRQLEKGYPSQYVLASYLNYDLLRKVRS